MYFHLGSIYLTDLVVVNVVPSAVFEIVPVKAVKDEDVKDVRVEKCESEDETEIKAEVKDETKDEIKAKIKEEDRE